MRILRFAVVAALISLPVCGAQAAVEAFSRLDISAFGLFTDSFGAKRPVDVSDFTSVVASNSASASAVLNSTGTATLAPAGSVDTALAIVGPGGIGTPAAILENDFTRQLAGFEPFTRGDTTGFGALITGTPAGFASGATTVAETQLPLAPNGDMAASSSEVGNTTEISLTVATPIHIIAELMAEQLLVAELMSPPGFSASASTGFSISITDDLAGGAPVFFWAPGGSGPGAIFGGTAIADPFSLNASVGQTGITGTDTISHVPTFFSADVFLPSGSFTVTIDHGSNSAASNFVPEPTSLFVWGGLAFAFGLSSNRRRRS